jgi:hypothetical protein
MLFFDINDEDCRFNSILRPALLFNIIFLSQFDKKIAFQNITLFWTLL